MRPTTPRTLAIAAVLSMAGSAGALAASPVGIWIDHTGRGAVEIKECGSALCGRVVWVKAAADKEGCNLEIIGGAKQSGSRWDGGWIYDPEAGRRYDVELTPVGEQKLRVLGYMGIKMFGETMTWTRAPANLERCDAPQPAVRPQSASLAVPAAPAEPAKAAEAPAAPPPKPVAAAPAPLPAQPPAAATIDPPADRPAPSRMADASPAAPSEPPAAAASTPAPSGPSGRSAPRAKEARLPDLGGIKFEQRQVSAKSKECTIRVPDFGAFSFAC